jgi:hypothetical protein
VLTKYLNSCLFKDSIRRQLPEDIFGEVMTEDHIQIALPDTNEGVKQYNGVDCWYWLTETSSYSFTYFINVTSYGDVQNTDANNVGGCAPMFRLI